MISLVAFLPLPLRFPMSIAWKMALLAEMSISEFKGFVFLVENLLECSGMTTMLCRQLPKPGSCLHGVWLQHAQHKRWASMYQRNPTKQQFQLSPPHHLQAGKRALVNATFSSKLGKCYSRPTLLVRVYAVVRQRS